MKKLYPFIFEPILKEVLWGGTDICPFKGLPPSEAKIGESWELSDVAGHSSVIVNGEYAGQTLNWLMKNCAHELLGSVLEERYRERFPLLVKFIDAKHDLSIQVHPDDTLAKARHNSFGKTEMWYVVKAHNNASLYSGFSQQIDADEYLRRIADGTFTDVLKRYAVKTGDVFFLPAGRVHAIGAGCFMAEIQQTSDITYRIYDYDRRDADGNKRELHTELAKDAIDYTVHSDYRTDYKIVPNGCTPLADCSYFTTNLYDLDAPVVNDYSSNCSFVIYIVVEGAAMLRDDAGNELSVRRGQTVLFPASTQTVAITPSGQAKIIETFCR